LTHKAHDIIFRRDHLDFTGLTGLLKGSTAFSQFVKKLHDPEKIGNHWSNCIGNA